MDIRYGIISTINLQTVILITVLGLFIVYVSIMENHGRLFLSRRVYYARQWKFSSVVITLLQSFISKICLINHHAPFTYREIGFCVLTSQSSRFLAHVSAASQPLNLNSPCLPGSKIALFSGFHLINSGSESHSQGNVYAHARSCKLYKSRRKWARMARPDLVSVVVWG